MSVSVHLRASWKKLTSIVPDLTFADMTYLEENKINRPNTAQKTDRRREYAPPVSKDASNYFAKSTRTLKTPTKKITPVVREGETRGRTASRQEGNWELMTAFSDSKLFFSSDSHMQARRRQSKQESQAQSSPRLNCRILRPKANRNMVASITGAKDNEGNIDEKEYWVESSVESGNIISKPRLHRKHKIELLTLEDLKNLARKRLEEWGEEDSAEMPREDGSICHFPIGTSRNANKHDLNSDIVQDEGGQIYSRTPRDIASGLGGKDPRLPLDVAEYPFRDRAAPTLLGKGRPQYDQIFESPTCDTHEHPAIMANLCEPKPIQAVSPTAFSETSYGVSRQNCAAVICQTASVRLPSSQAQKHRVYRHQVAEIPDVLRIYYSPPSPNHRSLGFKSEIYEPPFHNVHDPYMSLGSKASEDNGWEQGLRRAGLENEQSVCQIDKYPPEDALSLGRGASEDDLDDFDRELLNEGMELDLSSDLVTGLTAGSQIWQGEGSYHDARADLENNNDSTIWTPWEGERPIPHGFWKPQLLH